MVVGVGVGVEGLSSGMQPRSTTHPVQDRQAPLPALCESAAVMCPSLFQFGGGFWGVEGEVWLGGEGGGGQGWKWRGQVYQSKRRLILYTFLLRFFLMQVGGGV